MLSAGLRVNMGLHLLVVLSLCLCYKAVGEGITNVKPIQQRDDREFDCVDIYKQPAFDHPLLKNHKIQMAPSFSGNVLNNYDTKIGKFSKIGLQDEGCPPGMVPIMKIKSSHLRNEYSHSKYHSKNFTDDNPSQQFATYHTKSNNRINHGARAIISLENPSVEMGQYSMAQIWVQKGQFNGLESIQAGWAVDPVLYGDSRTRITTYWTVDNFGKTGCFNSECPGFVQVHPRFHPGSPFANISVFQGQQFVTDILIAQDKTSGHWWFTLDNQKIGYWPKNIFTLLANEARFFQFGGEAYRNINKPCPPMGNGHFPSRVLKESSYFVQMQSVSPAYNLLDIDPIIMDKTISNVGYDLVPWGNQGGNLKIAMTYGGPGGNCGQ